MKVLFFSDTKKNEGSSANRCLPKGSRERGIPGKGHYVGIIAELFSRNVAVEFCGTAAQLATRLSRPKTPPSVLVLVVDGPETLSSLITAKDLFDDTYVVVILAGEGLELQKRALSLEPRYIARDDDDPGHVSAVLFKLLERLAEKYKHGNRKLGDGNVT